jgi:V8-like Glu-specific endopeptidase
MELKGDRFRQLREALQRAYPDISKLKLLLREELNVRLNEVVGGNNLTETVTELVEWAEAEGRLVELVSAAIRRTPGNPRLRSFVESYGILPAEEKSTRVVPFGPEFEWRGPTEDRELQGFRRPKPELWDVAFLSRGVDKAASVCRIEVEGQGAIGTGFLVSPDLLLTNYHVFEDGGLAENLSRWRLGFGRMTSRTGTETIGQTFKLVNSPVIRSSPTDKLDYVLLRVESAILEAKTICPVDYIQKSPQKGTGIHVLQHPDGETMKIVFGTNGITGVYEDDGLIQYISQTSTGSSGSPCFNDDWQLIALHHAQRATTFGVRCEGILFSAIYPQIADVLKQD